MRKAFKDLAMLIEAARYCRKVRQGNGGGIGFLKALRLCRERRFKPSDAYYLGLLDTDLDETTLDRYVSRGELTKLQERVNPPSWADLLKNKGMFYRFCMANGVPVPALYALFFPGCGGVLSDGRWLAAKARTWTRFVDEELPRAFVFKPARGSNGDGVFIFRRYDGGFADATGRVYDPGEMWRLMSGDTFRPGLIIQERLHNHADLDRLTGSPFLQTVRACTFVETTGVARLLHAHLKLTARESAVDNFGVGLGGNLQCCVDLESGVPGAAVRLRRCGHGLERIERHPETGMAFSEFVLPHWGRFQDVVNRAAERFLPVRAVGWDVAITPAGPVVVEGNIWWGPNNPFGNMDKVRTVLASDVAPVAAEPEPLPV